MSSITFRIDRLVREKELEWNRRITYREIETETGVSATTLVRWRKNYGQRVDLGALARVAQYLECDDIGELLVLSTNGNDPRTDEDE